MEQQSPAKSPSASSQQTKQHDFMSSYLNADLSQMLLSFPQVCDNDKGKGLEQYFELPSSTQWKQTHDMGSSFSSASFMGDLLAQSQEANEDLSAIYLQGISLSSSDRQLIHANKVPNSNNELGSVDTYPQLDNYHLHVSSPLTNLHIPTSYFTFQGQSVGSPQISVPFELDDLAIMNTLPRIRTQTQKNDVVNESPVQIRLPGIQGISNPMYPSSLFNQASGSSFHATSNSNYQSPFNLTGSSSYYPQGPTTPRQKRRMVWEEDNVPYRRRWTSIFGRDQGQSSRSSHTSNGRFTLYDPRYEEIGLPMDPHLRIFNETKGNGMQVRPK